MLSYTTNSTISPTLVLDGRKAILFTGDTGWFTAYNGTTTSYTDAYAYRVDLKKPVELYFSKLFGLDDYEAKASAMAIFIIEPDEDNIKPFVEEISANIYNAIPNYYWQGIHNDPTIHIYNLKDGYSIEKDGLGKIYNENGYKEVQTRKGYMVYNLNEKMIKQSAKDSSGNYTEITGLFLDRPNIDHWAQYTSNGKQSPFRGKKSALWN